MDVSVLKAQADSGNEIALKQWALHHALTFLQESDPKNVEFLEPNQHSSEALGLFEKVAADHCQAYIWHGMELIIDTPTVEKSFRVPFVCMDQE